MNHLVSLLLLVSLIIPEHLFGQASDIAIDWGPIRKDKDTDFNEIIGVSGDLFYTLSTGQQGMFSKNAAKDYTVMGINRETKAVKFKRTLESFEYKGNKAIYKNGFINPKGNLVLYFTVYDNRNDTKSVLYREMDENGKFGAIAELTSMNAQKRSEGGFAVFSCRDSSKLVIYSEIPKERSENEEFKVEVFDRSHNVLWERSIILPYTNKYFTILDQALTNKGELFILGYSEPDRTKGERKERNSSNKDYKIYRLNAEEDIVEFDLNLDDKYVSDASIHADYFEELVAVPGFYSDKYEGAMSGSFFFTINQNNLEVITASTQPFSRDLLLNFMSERKADKGREIGQFEFIHFIRRKDGGAVVVAEQNYKVVTQTRTANGGYVQSVTYFSNDIIVININPTGDIEWSAVVPKKQTLGGPYYLSHVVMVDEDQLHFVYNDNPNNVERYGTEDKLKYMNNVKKSNAIIATVDGNGQVTHDLLFRNKSYKALLVPRKSYQSADDKIILFSENKSETRFGTMHMR